MQKKQIEKILYGWLIAIIALIPLHWLQIYFQIADYSPPTFMRLAWWAPLLYGILFLFMIILFPLLEEVLTATFTFKPKTIWIEFAAIFMTFIVPILTEDYPYLSTLVLAVYVLFRLGFFHAKWDWLFFLIGALLGPTVQIILISYNLYHYTTPDFMGLPSWLPFQCGIMTMSGRRIAHLIMGESSVNLFPWKKN